MEKTTFNRKNITIATDDFGINSRTNNNILQLARLGKINRVAVLVSGFVSKPEIEELLKNSVKLDLHLTLPEGIRKRRGVFRRSFLFLSKYALRKSSIPVLEREWERQIQLFIKNYGFIPHGLNSHEYIHFFPPYFKIALRLCKKHNISYLRFGKSRVLKNGKLVSKILYLLHSHNRLSFNQYRLDSSDNIASLDWIHNIHFWMKKNPAGTTELICHPERKEEFEIINKYF
jgi:predicted glycoside hydrolase/deacetylase ChbG (UPF0249 family)